MIRRSAAPACGITEPESINCPRDRGSHLYGTSNGPPRRLPSPPPHTTCNTLTHIVGYHLQSRSECRCIRDRALDREAAPHWCPHFVIIASSARIEPTNSPIVLVPQYPPLPSPLSPKNRSPLPLQETPPHLATCHLWAAPTPSPTCLTCGTNGRLC